RFRANTLVPARSRLTVAPLAPRQCYSLFCCRAIGTTFVTLSRETPGNEPGFWMHDGMLELWLRLLALHLPEPTDSGETQATPEIRNLWQLASRGYFVGCVPHGMEDACATQEGRAVVRMAIDSLVAALGQAETPLDADTRNLLGIEGWFTAPIERKW